MWVTILPLQDVNYKNYNVYCNLYVNLIDSSLSVIALDDIANFTNIPYCGSDRKY